MAVLPGVILNGQISLASQRQTLSGLGKMFVCTNPTPGTAIAYAQLTSFSATANGLFTIYNSNGSGGANIYLDQLTLIQTAAAPTGTKIRWEVYMEAGQVIGTTAVAARVPQNLLAGGAGTGAIWQGFDTGAITIPAAVGARSLKGIGSLPIGVNVAQDVYVVDFGADGPSAGRSPLTAARATDPGRLTTQMPPVVIPPGFTAIINQWGQGTATPSFEWAFTYLEF